MNQFAFLNGFRVCQKGNHKYNEKGTNPFVVSSATYYNKISIHVQISVHRHSGVTTIEMVAAGNKCFMYAIKSTMIENVSLDFLVRFAF